MASAGRSARAILLLDTDTAGLAAAAVAQQVRLTSAQ